MCNNTRYQGAFFDAKKGVATIENKERSSFSPVKGDVFGGRYRIVGTIGRGGMGTVFAVEDLKLGGSLRAVKVTVPPPDGSGSYIGEANTLMKLNHPHLPLIIDYFPPNEQGYEALVMDYIDGQTVADYYVKPYGGFTFAQIIHIGFQLCSALIYLHGQMPPIIHRDLKPSNVMIDSKGHVKLIDLGISRQYKLGQLQDTVQLGTVGYAAPEQEGAGQSDARTDIYGLGGLFYYMASGGKAYHRNDVNISGKDPFVHLQTDIPHSFKSILRQMLQSNPQHRYRSMIDVESALKSLERRLTREQGEGPATARSPIIRSKRICASVISLSPGAGATLVSLSLAALLGRRGVSVAAAEYSGLRPEWHALLMQRARRTSYEQNEAAFDERYIRYKQPDSLVSWFTLHPEQLANAEPDDHKFEQMLRHAGAVIDLIDLSAKWDEPLSFQLLRQSRFVFVVGDPSVTKWQARDFRKLDALDQELQGTGGSMVWIANKDIRFSGRSEWLSLFPTPPAAAIPLLSQEAIMNAQWNGRWFMGETGLNQRLNRALEPIFTLLYNEINTH